MLVALGLGALAALVPEGVIGARGKVAVVAWIGTAAFAPPVALFGPPAWLLVGRLVRFRRLATLRRMVDADIAVLARGVLIALSGGVSIPLALSTAARSVHPDLATEVDGVLRRSRSQGLAVTLMTADGHARRLYTVLARAQATGSSVVSGVAALIEQMREEEREQTVAAARRLPVKLSIPLTLLILPGFVVLTIGPSVLDAATRMLGPLVSVP